jgi:xanthine dehydrogenase accessory factor
MDTLATTTSHQAPIDIIDEIGTLRHAGEPFAVATVVRTVALTAAKAGAKAIIRSDGSISAGWIGGGCARAAVLKAARACLVDGKPRLVSVQPGDTLASQGVTAGQSRDGIEFAKNMCPSQGTMDVFVEPMLPKPELLICGATPVATALADLARRLGFLVVVAAPAEEHAKFGDIDGAIDGYQIAGLMPAERYVVVATQGRGDEAALSAALGAPSRYVSFVGSRRKAQSLRASLALKGTDAARLAALRSPAGLDIGAVTPEEIALSILGEIVTVRRGNVRTGELDE